MDYINKAKEVIDIEIRGLEALKENLDESFERLLDLCRETMKNHGKLVICGVGKSGHIGLKIAATLASTGTQSVFLHPVEAMHGDLGVLSDRDLLIAMSYSGETEELLQVIPAAKRLNVPIVGICSDPESQLAEYADFIVNIKVPEEACPFNLAPTSSTTAMLAFGDALAMVLMQVNKFSMDDYSKLHPAGAIGRSITMTVADIMRSEERTPLVKADLQVKDALMKMTQCRSGSVVIVDDDGKLLGVFTDGDFRRCMQENKELMDESLSAVMTKNPISLNASEMAVSLLKLLEEREIDDIPVVDDANKVLGLIDIQDLPKFKLM
ncbi:MAG: KpsF/GutQ family sugar-phosphate isomerase [Lentisphaeria bacterium]|nr:KpsF/GutQ family sugar-phosphate isomerase [Lentisphaeria bacterium]NQZ68079.1 KpsF/GutQ family sugar-phosphate isomerase [Lentisphaeria bacterium]